MDPLYFIIFGAVILVAIYLTYYFVSKQLEKDHLIVQQIKNILEQYGKLDENGHHPKFTFNEQSYYVKFLKIKPNVKFKFNSKTIWEKRFSGKVQYTDQTVFSKLPGRKLVIIYPSEGPFMYQYDENEIKFTTPKTKVWDYVVIPYNELEEVLKEGIK